MATRLTMDLDAADAMPTVKPTIPMRASRLAAGSSALAIAFPDDRTAAFRLTGRELITREECKRRLRMTGVTVAWLINDLKVLDLAEDDLGRERVVWVFGTDRQSLLDRYVAERGIPRDPAAFEAYRAVLRGLDRGVVHRDEVILAARDFLVAEGIAANAHELAGLIGGRVQLVDWVKSFKLASGQFVELRTLTGSNYVAPTETFDDVLRRLDFGKHVPEGTLGDPALRDPIFEPTGYQCRNLMLIQSEPLFRTVAMYLLIKLVDDVLPATVDRILQIAFRLDHVLRGIDLSDARQVTERLDEYVADKSILTDDSDGVRATTVYLLYSMYETIGDWCDLLPVKERAFFRRFEVALPRRSSKFIKMLSGMDRNRLGARLTRRKGRSDRLVAGFDLSRFLVDVRFNMVRRMHEAFAGVRRELAAMTREERDAKLPYDFWYVEHVPACLDEPAVEQMVRLRVVTRQGLMADLGFDGDGKVIDHDMAQRTRGTRYYDEATEDDYLLEYVDTIGLAGAEARPLWMVDRVRTCFFMNPSYLDAEHGTLRRAAMREMHMGTSHSQHAGLFIGWGGRDGNSVPYRAMSRQGRTFLPIDSIYMMAAIGRISIRITTTNGARPSEILQLMIDDERWGEVYDEANRVDVTYFEAVPKMKDDWFVFFVDEDTRQAIEDLIDFLSERYYGGGNLPVVAPAKCLYSKRLHGEPLPHARYIMSWNGIALDHVEFSICQRLMMHGFGDFLPYDTRHAFATMARAENMPADVLQKLLHHERPSQTAMYSDPTAQEKAQHFTIFAARRHEVADLIAGGDTLDGGDAEAFDRVGGLGRTPCGHCMNPHPCGDRTACVGCAYNRSDPAFRAEALRELAHAERRLRDAEEEGFTRFAEQAKSDVDDVRAILREMDLIELSRRDNASHADVTAGVPEPSHA